MARKHPLPYISELKDLIQIRNFDDILRINNFVYSIVPSVNPPYEGEHRESLRYFYDGFKKKEIGGWCGLNYVFLEKILAAYGIVSRVFNYGISASFLTHMVAIVPFEGQRYLLDPFFNKHYTDKEGKSLTIDELFSKLVFRDLDDIVAVLGKSRKPVTYIPHPLNRDVVENKKWVNFMPEVFELKVINNFKACGLEDALDKRFNNKNPLLMMFLNVWQKY